MLIIKLLICTILFVFCYLIGLLLSKRYVNRVSELKEIKNALNIFKTKIRFTYEPVPEIFESIGHSIDSVVGNIFTHASKHMKTKSAEHAWDKAIEETENLSLSKEDKEVLKNLSKQLGKTDLEGQISEIELVETFINIQIEKSEKDREKNEKLYKTLGAVFRICISNYINLIMCLDLSLLKQNKRGK